MYIQTAIAIYKYVYTQKMRRKTNCVCHSEITQPGARLQQNIFK